MSVRPPWAMASWLPRSQDRMDRVFVAEHLRPSPSGAAPLTVKSMWALPMRT